MLVLGVKPERGIVAVRIGPSAPLTAVVFRHRVLARFLFRGVRIVSVENFDVPLLELIVNEGEAVEFWEHQVLLLEDEGRHIPVLDLVRVVRLRADASNLVRPQHQRNDSLAELQLVPLISNLVDQVLLLLVVLLAQILDFPVVVLVLLTERVDDFSLRLHLSRQVLVGLLHHQHFLFLRQLLLQEFFFSLFLSLELFLEFSVLVCLFLLFFSEDVATLNQL